MYASFFGLKQAPFSIAPDPRYLFMSERHREALAHLLYGVGGGGGFVLLTGEIGAGKTTVCRCFLEQVPRRCNVAYIFNPKLTVVELLQTVCDEFHIPDTPAGAASATVKDYLDPLNEYLLKTHAVGQNNVLIIDEAQSLSADVLEQLRLLTNLETNERKLLQIILIGQPELRDMLDQPELEQLAQRVTARFHLDALSEPETAQYIQHRLKVAGLARGPLFDSEAVRRIYHLTQGVPRRINLLCDRALLGAYAEDRHQVGRAIVDKAAAEVLPQAARKRTERRRALATVSLTWADRPRLALAGTVLAGLSTVSVAAWVYQRQQSRPEHPSASAPWTGGERTAHADRSRPALQAPASGEAMASAPRLGSAADLMGLTLADEQAALSALATRWQATLDPGDVCQTASRQQLKCFRHSGGLSLIRLLERPVVLELTGLTGQTRYALLVGLDARHAQIQLGPQTMWVTLDTLATLWQGHFVTLWRTPPDYRAKIAAGQTGPVVGWLGAQLARIQGQPAPGGQPPRFDQVLQASVQAFQLAHGLTPDGVVGATTLMQLNRAAGVDEPRLNLSLSSSPSHVLHP